jgi:hypothetical protein
MSRYFRARRSSTWTSAHAVEAEISVGPSDLWQITGEITLHMVHDSNADCDADGHRGRDVTYEDERTFILTSAAQCQPDGEYGPVLISDAIPADVRQAAQDWADVEEVDDDGADDEDEPDYDDWRERREDARG